LFRRWIVVLNEPVPEPLALTRNVCVPVEAIAQVNSSENVAEHTVEPPSSTDEIGLTAPPVTTTLTRTWSCAAAAKSRSRT